MILSGWATQIDNPLPFRGEVVNSVEIAIGRNEKQQRVKYFCLTRKAGLMFATECIERYEIHKLHDVVPESPEVVEVRQWLIQNIDPIKLQKLIQSEKSDLLTSYARHATKLISVKFDDPERNYVTGVSKTATDCELEDFFLHNTFTDCDGKEAVCTSISVYPNQRVLELA